MQPVHLAPSPNHTGLHPPGCQEHWELHTKTHWTSWVQVLGSYCHLPELLCPAEEYRDVYLTMAVTQFTDPLWDPEQGKLAWLSIFLDIRSVGENEPCFELNRPPRYLFKGEIKCFLPSLIPSSDFPLHLNETYTKPKLLVLSYKALQDSCGLSLLILYQVLSCFLESSSPWPIHGWLLLVT